jgi:hypothetical protein
VVAAIDTAFGGGAAAAAAACSCGLSELSVQQCHSCKNVYCSSCSVLNYDAREDRVFCLDCLPGTVSVLLLLLLLLLLLC